MLKHRPRDPPAENVIDRVQDGAHTCPFISVSAFADGARTQAVGSSHGGAKDRHHFLHGKRKLCDISYFSLFNPFCPSGGSVTYLRGTMWEGGLHKTLPLRAAGPCSVRSLIPGALEELCLRGMSPSNIHRTSGEVSPVPLLMGHGG